MSGESTPALRDAIARLLSNPISERLAEGWYPSIRDDDSDTGCAHDRHVLIWVRNYEALLAQASAVMAAHLRVVEAARAFDALTRFATFGDVLAARQELTAAVADLDALEGCATCHGRGIVIAETSPGEWWPVTCPDCSASAIEASTPEIMWGSLAAARRLDALEGR
jgi:hypothetical protein